jgi:hypothetical protein
MTGADIAAGGLTRGQAAIEIVYRESPRDYLKVIVSVFPKEFTHELADQPQHHIIGGLLLRAPVIRREDALIEEMPDQ